MTSAYDPDPPAKTPRKVLSIAGALALVALVAIDLVPELGDLVPRTRDQEAVVAAVQRTIVANQSIGILAQRNADGTVAPAVVEAARAQVRAVAAQLFTEAYRDTWIKRTNDAIDVEVAGDMLFDGGAYDFTRWRIAIQGDHAVVRVRCRIWLEMAQTFNGARHRAENTVDYEMTLDRVGDVWLVAHESHRFAPGGGP